MNDIEIIAKRYLDKEMPAKNIDEAKELLASMQADGSWCDIDYTGEKKPIWKTVEHLFRLNKITASELADDMVVKGLEYWFNQEIVDSNWWWNDIGFPMRYSVSAVKLRNVLPADLKERIINSLNDDVAEEWTGANRNWLAENIIVRGVLAEDDSLIMHAKDLMEKNLYISDLREEGIQFDYAFAQHGPQLYSNGYGRDLILDCIRWAKSFDGTKFMFSKEKIDLLAKLVLDGIRHMCWHGTADFNTIGRDIVRGYKGIDRRMEKMVPEIEDLAQMSDKKEELLAFADFLRGGELKKCDDMIKMFTSLNILTAQQKKGYASVRFGSDKVLAVDCYGGKIINGEDKWSAYRGAFISQYMKNGDEYDGVYPIWDWSKMPGTTTPDKELPTMSGAKMKTTFAGGKSNGKIGVAAMDMHEEFPDGDSVLKFGGKVACFMFDDQIVQLGCKLYSDSGYSTTINQCNFAGEYLADGKSAKFGKLEAECSRILHNGIGYRFFTPQTVNFEAEHKTGNWNKITEMSEPDGVKAEGDIFAAYIKNPTEYAYSVLIDCDDEKLQTTEPPEIINTEICQAVAYKDTVLAVFYQAGKIEIAGKTLEAYEPGFVCQDAE